MQAGQDAQNIQTHYTSTPRSVAVGGEPAEPAKPKGLNPFPVLRTLQRNILIIAGVTGLAALFSLYSGARLGRSYLGNFRILVEPITSQARSTDPSALSRVGGSENSTDYATLLQVLQSPEVLDRIAKQIQSRYPDVTGNSLLGEIFSKDLVVQRLGATSPDPTRVLEITYRGKDPQKTQFILEELAKGYLRYSLDDRTSRIGGGIGFIEDQLPNLQQRVRSLEDQLQALKQRYRLLDPTVEGSSISKQLQDTRAQRVQTERELAEQQAAYNRLTGQLGLTPDEALAASSLSENPTYQSLIAQIKTLDAQIAIKSARYTEEGYPVASLLSQRKNLERLLEDETRRNLGQSFSGISQDSQIRTFQNETRLGLIKQLVDTAGTTQLLQIRREAVSKAEASLDQQLQEYPEIVRRYNDLQQQLDISTKTLNQFLTQRETLRIESAQKELPWEIISAPSIFKNAQGQAVPEDGGASKRMLTNLGIGLALGILAALLKEKIRNIFYSSLDVPDALNLPALSVVPFKKGSQQMSRSLPPNDPFAKAFGSLYTNLRFLTAQPVRSVVIGSAVAGEGKTLVALNLATTAAALGQRVLLVDANLRDPQLHTLFDLTHARGLTEVLTEDKMSWEEAIVPLEPNLSLLTAGQVSQNSAQLLASKEMQSVMHQMQSAFDLVIYDSPNMSEFSDTTFLAGQTEGVVMVVSVRKVKRSRVKQALAELKKFRLPVLGLVSNHPGKRANAVAAEKDPYENLYASKPALLGLNGLNSASPTPLPQSRDVVR